VEVLRKRPISVERIQPATKPTVSVDKPEKGRLNTITDKTVIELQEKMIEFDSMETGKQRIRRVLSRTQARLQDQKNKGDPWQRS
jgi:hypothetical protein